MSSDLLVSFDANIPCTVASHIKLMSSCTGSPERTPPIAVLYVDLAEPSNVNVNVQVLDFWISRVHGDGEAHDDLPSRITGKNFLCILLKKSMHITSATFFDTPRIWVPQGLTPMFVDLPGGQTAECLLFKTRSLSNFSHSHEAQNALHEHLKTIV